MEGCGGMPTRLCGALRCESGFWGERIGGPWGFVQHDMEKPGFFTTVQWDQFTTRHRSCSTSIFQGWWWKHGKNSGSIPTTALSGPLTKFIIRRKLASSKSSCRLVLSLPCKLGNSVLFMKVLRRVSSKDMDISKKPCDWLPRSQKRVPSGYLT